MEEKKNEENNNNNIEGNLLINNNSNINELSNIFDTTTSLRKNLIEEEESKDILLTMNIKKNNEEKNLEQYLKPKYWKYKEKKNFEEINKNFEQSINTINKKEIKKLKNIINKKDIEDEINDNNKIQKLGELMEFNENDENKLKENIYKFRKIFKDNNNFFRCVIFSIFENVILNNNIMFFKELLIEIDSIFSSENYNSNNLFQDDNLLMELKSNIKIDLLKKIIYLLLNSMSKSITSSYELLIKIYLSKDEFDSSIILLIRYLLCFYINENKFKIYSKFESIEIMDLLPQKYKEMHISLQKKFELFYINELLKNNSYDNKMIYYLLPCFFNINLNIIYYYPNSKDPIYQHTYGINEENDTDIFINTINLFFYKNSFNIYYTKKYYEFYSKILALYEEKIILDQNLIEENSINNNNEIINDDEKNNIKENNNNTIILKEKYICKNCNKEYNNEENKENILKLCTECLNEEFKKDIDNIYINYLQCVKHNNKNYKYQIDTYFYSILHTTKIKEDISLFKLMSDNGYIIYKGINEIKKNICLICTNKNTEIKYYYQLPCGCRICSENCFNKYLHIIIKKDYEKMCKNSFEYFIFLFDFCICGKRYYYEDIILVYNFLKEKNRFDECNMIIKIVNNRWIWKCTKCDNDFDPFCLNKRLNLIDDKICKDFYENNFKHLICSNCYDYYYRNHKKNIKCNYCKSEHIIIDNSKLNYQNKIQDSCSNF